MKGNYLGLAAICLLGVLPLLLSVLGVPSSTPLAILLLLVNLATCIWMVSLRRLAWMWLAYAASCIATMIFAGMTSPITLGLVLIFWRFL